MPTTSNFGWTTPADTDLVKDGAAAIRTLGNGIDSSFIDLKGGTTGQVLSKASNTDLDYSWVTPNVGDITEVQAGTGISIASGTGPIPVVTNTVATAFDAAGDLVYGTGADTFTKLSLGTAGQVLTVNSGATAPEWTTASSGGLTLISSTLASGSGFNLSSIPGTYKSLLLVWSGVYHSTSGSNFCIRFNNNSGSVYVRNNFGWREGLGVDIGSADATAIDGNSSPFGTELNSSAVERTVKGYLYIDNYASTTLFKMFYSQYSFYETTSSRNQANSMQGFFESTSAISEINIVRTTGSADLAQITNTDVRLYGVS